MNLPRESHCPECNETMEVTPTVDRRNFIRVLTGSVAALTAGGVPRLFAEDKVAEQDNKPADKEAKTAETLIQELYADLSNDQKKSVLLAWDHGPKNGTPTRLGMYNTALLKQPLGKIYTKAQQELIEKILRAMVSGDEGYQRISRNGKWDGSKAFENCGCHLFGEPVQGKKYAMLFTGHHLTLRCDEDQKDGLAWGGPMYYGHSVDGWNEKNVFHYQTKSVQTVYKALDAKLQAKAIATGKSGEGAGSIEFRKDSFPGLAIQELDKEQKALVEKAMVDILSPYRKEDAEEAMATLKANGGWEKMHLAFYRDKDAKDAERWHFWRLEGPGFVWNYRILPHVHCYVNIGPAKA